MLILGHGIDLVEVQRIERMLERYGERFITRCFTQAERDYCDQRPARRAEHYAARFAAKEAVVKALGTGFRSGIGWTQIEIRREPAGGPCIELCGSAKRVADEKGVSAWRVSLSHTRDYATASVIAVG